MNELNELINARLAEAHAKGYEEGYEAAKNDILVSLRMTLNRAETVEEEEVETALVRPGTMREKVLRAYQEYGGPATINEIRQNNKRLFRGLTHKQLSDTAAQMVCAGIGLRRVAKGTYELA